MEEQLISFETAKLAKEKWFNIPGVSIYSGGLLFKNVSVLPENWNKSVDETCSAPTQSILQKWLRDNMNIDVLVFHKNRIKGTTWTSEVHFNDHLRYTNHDYENDYTYEEALEQGLQEALKLI